MHAACLQLAGCSAGASNRLRRLQGHKQQLRKRPPDSQSASFSPDTVVTVLAYEAPVRRGRPRTNAGGERCGGLQCALITRRSEHAQHDLPWTSTRASFARSGSLRLHHHPLAYMGRKMRGCWPRVLAALGPQRHAEAGPTTREKNLPRTALHAESLSCRSHAGNNRPRRTATATAVIYQASHTQRAGHHSTCCGKTFNGARRAGARAQLTSVPTQRNGKEQKGSGDGQARDAGASGAGPCASAPAKQRNGNITVTVQVQAVFKRPPAAPRPGLYTLLYSTLDPRVPKGDSHFRGGAEEVSASDSAIRDPRARARPRWRRARRHAGSHGVSLF